MPNLIPSTDRSLASRGLGIERPFILRQTSRDLERLQSQTVLRVATVQAEGLVQTEKAREIDHLTRDAMSGQALLAKWRDFFFSSRRRHTRCSRDWSSDVCSSD